MYITRRVSVILTVLKIHDKVLNDLNRDKHLFVFSELRVLYKHNIFTVIFKATSASKANYICRKSSLFIVNHSYYFGIITVMKDFQNEVLSTLILPNTLGY